MKNVAAHIFLLLVLSFWCPELFAHDVTSDKLLSKIGASEPVVLIEIDDPPELANRFRKLKVWSDPRWQRVFELLENDEHGFLAKESTSRIEEFASNEQLVQFERLVIVFNSVKPLDFELFLKCQGEVSKQFVERWVQSGNEFLRANRRDKNVNDNNNIDESNNNSNEKRHVEADEKTGDISATSNPFRSINWDVHKDWIVVGSSKLSLGRAMDRMRSDTPLKRSVANSRRRKVLRVNLQIEAHSGFQPGIFVQFDPRFIRQMGWINDDWYRLLQVDELLAAAFQIGFRGSNDDPNFAVSGLILTSVPQVGLASIVKPIPIPESLPPIPDSVQFLSVSSIERDTLWDGYDTVLEKTIGDKTKRHLVFGAKYEQHPQQVNDYLDAYAIFNRNINGCIIDGVYSDHETLGSGAFMFSRMDQTEENVAIVRKMLDGVTGITGSPRGKPARYVETKKNGYTVFEHPMKKSPEHIIWWNGWVIKCNQTLIDYFASQKDQPNVRFRDELADQIENTRRWFGHKHQVALIKAYWPKHFASYMEGFAFEAIRENLANRPPEIFTQAMKEEWESFDVDNPRNPISMNQARQFAVTLIGQIAKDAIGKVVVIGSVEENGFRLSATNFPLRSDLDRESKDTK